MKNLKQENSQKLFEEFIVGISQYNLITTQLENIKKNNKKNLKFLGAMSFFSILIKMNNDQILFVMVKNYFLLGFQMVN